MNFYVKIQQHSFNGSKEQAHQVSLIEFLTMFLYALWIPTGPALLTYANQRSVVFSGKCLQNELLLSHVTDREVLKGFYPLVPFAFALWLSNRGANGT